MNTIPRIENQSFQLGRSGRTAEIWWKAPRPWPAYFDQHLTSLFDREIVFEKLELDYDARLIWRFSGPLGMVVIRLSPHSIAVQQIFHDSFAHNTSDPIEWGWWDALGESAQKTWKEFTQKLQALPKSIRVTVDHHMDLKIYLDGALLTQQHLLIDLHLHQLQLTGGDVVGKLLVPAPRTVSLQVHPEKKRQEIIGFGGTGIATAYHLLSEEGKNRWFEILKESNLLIQRECPASRHLHPECNNFDHIEDAPPHYYGENFPNCEISDFGYNRRIHEIGGQVWFEFWELPKWVYPSEVKPGALRGDCEVDHEGYARAYVEYCKQSVAKSGKPPAIVGVQNEICQSADNLARMILTLREQLDAAGFQEVKIHSANSPAAFWFEPFMERHKANPAAWEKLDFVASNWYDCLEHLKNPDGYDPIIESRVKANTGGKDLLGTELCPIFRAYQVKSWRPALNWAQIFHKILALAEARALVVNYTLCNNVHPSFNWTRTLFTVDESRNRMPVAESFTARALIAFSRFIRKGMTRVETTSDDSDLLATVWLGAEGEGTAVLVNRGTTPAVLSLHDLPFTPRTRMDTGHTWENYCQPLDGKPEITIEPGGIVSLSTLA